MERSERRVTGVKIDGLMCYDPIPWGGLTIYVSPDVETVRAYSVFGKKVQRLDPAMTAHLKRNMGDIVKLMNKAGFPEKGRAVILPWDHKATD